MNNFISSVTKNQNSNFLSFLNKTIGMLKNRLVRLISSSNQSSSIRRIAGAALIIFPLLIGGTLIALKYRNIRQRNDISKKKDDAFSPNPKNKAGVETDNINKNLNDTGNVIQTVNQEDKQGNLTINESEDTSVVGTEGTSSDNVSNGNNKEEVEQFFEQKGTEFHKLYGNNLYENQNESFNEQIENFVSMGGVFQIIIDGSKTHPKSVSDELGLNNDSPSMTFTKEGIRRDSNSLFSKKDTFIACCTQGQNRSQIAAILLEEQGYTVEEGVIGVNGPIDPGCTFWTIEHFSDESQTNFKKAFNNRKRKPLIEMNWYPAEAKEKYDNKKSSCYFSGSNPEIFAEQRKKWVEYFDDLKPHHFVCFTGFQIVMERLLARKENDLTGFKVTFMDHLDTISAHPGILKNHYPALLKDYPDEYSKDNTYSVKRFTSFKERLSKQLAGNKAKDKTEADNINQTQKVNVVVDEQKKVILEVEQQKSIVNGSEGASINRGEGTSSGNVSNGNNSEVEQFFKDEKKGEAFYKLYGTKSTPLSNEHIQDFVSRGGVFQIIIDESKTYPENVSPELGLNKDSPSMTFAKEGISRDSKSLFSKKDTFITCCTQGQNRSQIAAILLEDQKCKVEGVICAKCPIDPNCTDWTIDYPTPESRDNFKGAFNDRARKPLVGMEWFPEEDREEYNKQEPLWYLCDEERGTQIIEKQKEQWANYFNEIKPRHFVCFNGFENVMLRLLKEKKDLTGFKITFMDYSDTISLNVPAYPVEFSKWNTYSVKRYTSFKERLSKQLVVT